MVDAIHRCCFCKKQESIELYPTQDIFENNYAIHQCCNCKAYFLAPPPTDEQLKQAYDDSYYGEQEEKFSSPLIEKVLDSFRMGRARRLSKYLKEDSKVLDIGCGNGRFLNYLRRFGDIQLYGIEQEGNSALRASKIDAINLKTGSLQKDDFADSTFDALTLFHVFEHLSNPKEILEIIASILKRGGVLVFSFPNIVSWQSRMFKGKWLHLDPPRHLFFYAPNDFVNIMKTYGFELIKQHYVSMEQNPYGMIQSILNLWCKKREVLFERLKGNENYAPDYSKLNVFFQKIFFAFSFPFFIVTDILMSFFKKGATVEMTFRKIRF